MPDRGYLEFAHTADWGMHVWAGDLVSLLVTAAEGMFVLLEVVTDQKDRRSISFELVFGGSPESLLVDFLNELLYLSEREQIGFGKFDIRLAGEVLTVQAGGGKLVSQSKEIKAVTFHKLAVERTEGGLEAKLIFDV